MVLLYASKYHDVHRVINVSGRYKTEGGVEERLGKGYLQIVKDDGFIDVKAQSGILLLNESILETFLQLCNDHHLIDDTNPNTPIPFIHCVHV